MKELDVRKVYIRMLPHEVNRLEISERGLEVIFKLTYEDISLRVSRVRVAGRVGELHNYGNFIDVVVVDDEGNTRVRAWNSVADGLRSLPIGSCVEVFGRISSFRGEVYVAADFFRTISDAELSSYRDLVSKDRDLMMKYFKINLER